MMMILSALVLSVVVPVRFCNTYEEFQEVAEQGHCVAFMSFSHEDIEELRKHPIPITLGW